MAGKSASILVKILGEDSSLGKAVASAESKLDQLGGKMQSAGKTMMKAGGLVTAAITLPVLALGKRAIEGLQDAEKASAMVKSTFDSMKASTWGSLEAIEAHADGIERLTGLDADLVKEGQSLLLTFGNVQNKLGEGNDVFTRSTTLMTDMSVKMGTDMKSSSMLLGKALNDPLRGMNALRKAGVQLTEEQRNQVKAFVESGDVLSAQKVLLGELENQFGGTAKAFGETGAGKIERLKKRFDELTESVAEKLMPHFDRLVFWVMVAFDWFGKLGERGQNIAFIVALIAAAIGPAVTIIGGLVTAIGAILSPIGLVALAVAGLVAAFVYFYRSNEGFRDWVNSVVAALRGHLITAFNYLKDTVLPALVAAFRWVVDNVLPRLAAGLAWIGRTAVPILVAAFQFLVTGTRQAAEWIRTAWDWIWQKVSEFVGWFGANVAPVIGAAVELVVAYFQRVHSIVSTVFPIVATIVATVLGVVAGIISGFVSFLQPVWSALWSIIQTTVGAVWAGIKTIIETVLGVIRGLILTVTGLISGDWGKAWEGIKGIFGSIWSGIVSIASTSISAVLSVLGSVLGAITGLWGNVWSGLTGIVSGAINGVVGLITSLPGRILGALGAIGAAAAGIGSTILENIGRGISGAVGWVGDVAGKIWNAVKDGINRVVIEPIRGFAIPGAIPFVGGKRPFEGLPKLHSGGTVPGLPGSERPYLLEAGETVRTDEQERRLQAILRSLNDFDPPPGGAMLERAGASVTVNARTDADASQIGDEVAWQLLTSGV